MEEDHGEQQLTDLENRLNKAIDGVRESQAGSLIDRCKSTVESMERHKSLLAVLLGLLSIMLTFGFGVIAALGFLGYQKYAGLQEEAQEEAVAFSARIDALGLRSESLLAAAEDSLRASLRESEDKRRSLAKSLADQVNSAIQKQADQTRQAREQATMALGNSLAEFERDLDALRSSAQVQAERQLGDQARDFAALLESLRTELSQDVLLATSREVQQMKVSLDASIAGTQRLQEKLAVVSGSETLVLERGKETTVTKSYPLADPIAYSLAFMAREIRDPVDMRIHISTGSGAQWEQRLSLKRGEPVRIEKTPFMVMAESIIHGRLTPDFASVKLMIAEQ